MNGKYYVNRYDALVAKHKTVDLQMLLPRHTSSAEVTDDVALYGFRPSCLDLFFLSPWEFCQWFKPHRLRAPAYYTQMNHNPWTLMIIAGRAKLKAVADQQCKLKRSEDFVLNEKEVNTIPYLYPFPIGKEVFTGTPLKNYETFRHSWILIRRQRPVVPCPERCPLPQ